MEGVVVDRSIKMMRRTAPSENLAPMNYNLHGGGLLQAPPPSLSFFNHYRYHQLQQVQRQQQQHPPLLPLPVPANCRPYHNRSLPSLPSRTRSLTSPPTTARKTNTARSQSLTPKKPKSKPSKKEEAKQDLNNNTSEYLITASTTRLGPDPNDLPKDVTKVLMSSSSIGKPTLGGGVDVGDMDKFQGSIFTLSPPPSSLPLPRFSLQPRVTCKVKAAGIDTGATDNLCRLLRLR